jgi:alginate O-acetyltransferase complex protein AlgI
MLFNSYIFIFVFLPITIVGFFSLTKFRRINAAVTWITLSSVVFYGYWNPAYLPIIVTSMIVNYQVGLQISNSKQESKRAKTILWLGLVFNLVLLGYYKYANFFVSSLPFPAIANFIEANLNTKSIVLPLAISFFTFQQIAYLVDAYRGETKEYNFVDYCLFVTFFPQLIAGPIVHHKEIIPQFRKARTFLFSQKSMALGLAMFTLGLSKKVLIADNISPWVAPVFNHASSVSFIEAWAGAISYTLQLYFDFSGYSDMAIGLGLMFNVQLSYNFDSPYKATSISDFWRRWHITLSNFLRDYLYIPLGGSRRGEIRRYGNLLLTMLLGGLWHGAGWTFVLWGGLHGLYLCINHGWRQLKKPLPKFVAWTITFLAVIVAWVLFRAPNLHDATEILQAMAGMKGIVLPGEAQGRLAALTQIGVQLRSWKDLIYFPEVNGNKSLSLVVLFGLMLGVTLLPNTQEILKKLKPTWGWALWIGVLASLSLLSLNRVSEFLYFQF